MASSLAAFPLAFPSVGSSSAASNITQLRGHFLLHPLLPSPPTAHPFSIPLPFPLQLSRAGSSLHPRQPRALIITPLSRPVALKSTPPSPSLLRCPPPPPFSPPGFSPMEERHEEDVRILKMFCIQALSQERRRIRQTYGHVFKILSLFNQPHQSRANFPFCADGRAKGIFEDRCWREICTFSINIKVIIILH